MIWDMSSAPSPEDAHVLDSKAIDSRGASEDAAEGVMSFLEKREAEYVNKISSDMPSFLYTINKSTFACNREGFLYN